MGLQEAHNLSDVQRFYIIMAPTSRKDAPLRLAAVGKKQLPQTRDRFWACIQGLGKEVRALVCITVGHGLLHNVTSRRCVSPS